MSQFTTEDGCRIVYDVQGEGEPILFVHGWACNRSFFRFQVPELSKNYQVVTFDLRGHGESDTGYVTERHMTIARFAQDVHELIEHLGLEGVNLCGWSMGGLIVMEYQRQFGSDHLKTAAIIDMGPKHLADDEWKLGQGYTQGVAEHMKFSSLCADDWSKAAAMFGPGLFAKGTDLSGELPTWVAAQTANNMPHCMLASMISIADSDYREDLKTYDIPVFLAFSGDGFLYGPYHAQYMAERIPNATVDIFPGCGHALFMESPDKFNADYAAFIEANK